MADCYEGLIADRTHAIQASGIRRVFDLAAQLDNPINLSIGLPHFDVPQVIKEAANLAIQNGRNSYTPTQGAADFRQAVLADAAQQFEGTLVKEGTWADGTGMLVTSGVSGALVLLMMALVNPGDKILLADPYFVMYASLVRMYGGEPVLIDTYPDFKLNAARLRPHIAGAKFLLFSTPSNPTGVVMSAAECKEVAELCDAHNVLLVSDEIYDVFCHCPEEDTGRAPSPLRYTANGLLLRGASKTWAMTGWRLGWAIGPQAIIQAMAKLQQFSFVCAPHPVQAAGVVALKTSMQAEVDAYRERRDYIWQELKDLYQMPYPEGAFYAFFEVPIHLNMTGTQFVEKAITDHQLLMIPGGAFSSKDTHVRISYACEWETLKAGVAILKQMAQITQ